MSFVLVCLVFDHGFVVFSCFLFFFFKQKTAYEMRISDWSSDVCSSDLPIRARCPLTVTRPSPISRSASRREQKPVSLMCLLSRIRIGAWREGAQSGRSVPPRHAPNRSRSSFPALSQSDLTYMVCDANLFANNTEQRSEEHTSELQSLMRTSYAVFCLKKKKH